MSRPEYRIVGTAGHIDHGKSALVEALTGVDPDRLQEEKERGITIDLGFADTTIGRHRAAFVDVPGHERFVKNMLAGVGGIDAVLLVVAADESIMPQTREHVAICRLLGIDAGVVAITKCDLVDAEIAELVELEASELLEGTALAGAPVVHTSTADGSGLEELRDRLAEVLTKTADRPADGLLRLPVDRVFSLRGFGTIVTGTLQSGRVGVGDRLAVLPGDLEATVRGIQVHGEETEEAWAGQRTALNLQGVSVDDLSRGVVLSAPGALEAGSLIDARLDALPGQGGFEQLQRVRFHHGAAEVLARVAVLETEEIEPGGSGLVQLRLESPYPAVPGDRFVVRRYSPVVTIGGGRVIDRPETKARPGRPSPLLRELEDSSLDDRIAIHVREAGARGLTATALGRRLGVPAPEVARRLDEAAERGQLRRDGSGHALAEAVLGPLREQIGPLVNAYHERFPLRPAIPKEELRSALDPIPSGAVLDSLLEPLLETGDLRVEADGLAAREHLPRLAGPEREAADEILARYDREGFAPPAPDEVLAELETAVDAPRELLHFLLREGELVRIKDDLILHADAVEKLVDALRKRFARGDQFSVGDFRDWAGITRKHAIPLLEHLDAIRVTRRVGDRRERI